jgi:hypothetical protein
MASTERFKFRGLGILAAAALLVAGCAPPPGGGLGPGPTGPATNPLTGALAGSLPQGGQGAPEPAGFGGPAGPSTSAGSGVGAQIVSAAENLPNPFPYKPATNGGRLGCADVVTTALINAGVIARNEHQLAVQGTMNLLERKGWPAVNPPPYASGDVIIWDRPAGGRHMHIGIIAVENGVPYAIHNSSGQRRVVKVPLSSMGRRVKKIYRHPNVAA